MEAISKRPLGVTIISLLGFLGAIGLAIFGLGLIGLTGLASMSVASLGMFGTLLGGLGILAGIIVFALAVLMFAVSYGLWNMRKWAWTVTMILEGLSVILSLAAFNVIEILAPAIILYYLYTKKDLFQ